jgi:hypothetical protein
MGELLDRAAHQQALLDGCDSNVSSSLIFTSRKTARESPALLSQAP